MALPDLLQWAGVNRKSGLFQLHRNHLIRGIAFKEGQIVACATNDPSLIAHYLISGGKVRPEAIRDAVEEHRQTGIRLEQIVLDRGLLTAEEMAIDMADKSEETIYSLFDWVDAEFSFEEGEPSDSVWITVDTSVDEILLSGLQRLDEMKMIRKVFHSSGIVLVLTGESPPQAISNSGMARRIVESIDGKRSLADVLVCADASEFLVLKLLYHLFHKKVVQIAEVREPAPGSATLLDDPEELKQEPELVLLPDAIAGPSEAEAAPPLEPEEPEEEEEEEFFEEACLDPETLLNLARVAKQLEAGIEDAAIRQEPGPPRKRANGPLPDYAMESTPVPQHTPESLAAVELGFEEEYLVSIIDGNETLGGLLTLAPLERDSLLAAVQGLIEKKLIRLDESLEPTAS